MDIPKGVKPEVLGNLLTLKTAEVDRVIDESHMYDRMVVGFVENVHKHPSADKLKVANVSTGKETYQVVCGGENLREGMYVAFAEVGAKVKWHGEGDLVEIENVNLRGVESAGMICAGSEIGLTDTGEGPRDILNLSPLKPKIGEPLANILKKNDVIFEFDNKALTHRPDLWGHYGIAREVAALTGGKFKKYVPKLKLPSSGETVKVEISDKELCPRYCGLIIKNIKVGESPDWLKTRLRAAGHGLHGNIVDVTNYVMVELGQPMHAFDFNYIKGGIEVRRAKKGEKFKALDGKEYKLSEEMLVIADKEKAVALAGVIGGENSGINEGTITIILEAANFHAGCVRKTSVKLGIRTDAVQRFEKALDPHLAEMAMMRAAEIILEICPGAKVAGPISDVKNFDGKEKEISFDPAKAASKIGVDISATEMKKILEKLEFKVKADGKKFKVGVPSFRATKDVGIEDDLIEEVARMYGYEEIAPLLPTLPVKLPMENVERFRKHRAREIFSYALGFDEVYSYSFYGKSEIEKCLLSEEGHLKPLNYLTAEQTHLRVSLIPNLLKDVEENVRFFDEFKIYEIGRVYKDLGKYFPLEEKYLSGAVVAKGKKGDVFYTAKGAVEAFLKRFNVEFKMVRGVEAVPYGHPVKAITYLAEDGQKIASVFMIHPAVSRNFDLDKYKVALFEINFSEVMKKFCALKKYKTISKFPSVKFDVAVLVDEKIEVDKVREAIISADKALISDVELFDIYEGVNIEKGKKSLAFSVVLQSKEKTLADDEVQKAQEKVFENLKKAGGVVRGR